MKNTTDVTMPNISKHISYRESTSSPTAIRNGIKNEPNETELNFMRIIAKEVFEPLRNHFNVPIKIESFFRCESLNTLVGGSVHSQHRKGQAIDIDDDYKHLNNADMFYYIAENLEFDQLIWEAGNGRSPGWVHVSYVDNFNRNKISIMFFSKGRQKYKHFYNLEDFNSFKDKIYNTK